MMFWKQRNSHRNIIDAVFLWLSGIATDKDAICVDVAGRKDFFYFDFPLRYGDKSKKAKILPSGKEITFIIRKPESGNVIEEAEWINIFSSPEWKLFERKTRFQNVFPPLGAVKQSSPAPLRWRLNGEEKKIALKISRNVLEKFLLDGKRLEQEYFRMLPPRFHFKTDLDVAIWTRGCLRGSAVLENFNLGEGIAEAAIRAARDSRFKPLSFGELEHTRLEITIMQQPRVRLSDLELKKNLIYAEKGYFMTDGTRKGWYLPEVHNVKQFTNFREFLENLAAEKAHIDRNSSKNIKTFMFEIDDFIESEDRNEAIPLYGPVAKQEFKLDSGSQILDSHLRAAADWLCRIQEPDGNFPPLVNPLTGRRKQIDWPRFTFTAWALAEFGKITQDKKYLFASEKSLEYLRAYLFFDSEISISSRELTLAYFGRLSLALGKPHDAVAAAREILEQFGNLSFEPILLSQIASFFKILPADKANYSGAFETICGALKNAFEKERQDNNPMNLAVWAEICAVFSDIEPSFSEQIADWLKKQQLHDGAFPESTASDFTYVRGTGKIFEVLALEPEKNKREIEKALAWLFSMQYNPENTFFVPEEIRVQILGGFRHDYFNQEAWIDAAGHILLGASRLTSREH